MKSLENTKRYLALFRFKPLLIRINNYLCNYEGQHWRERKRMNVDLWCVPAGTCRDRTFLDRARNWDPCECRICAALCGCPQGRVRVLKQHQFCLLILNLTWQIALCYLKKSYLIASRPSCTGILWRRADIVASPLWGTSRDKADPEDPISPVYHRICPWPL